MATTFRSQGFNAFPRDPAYSQGKPLLTTTFRQSTLAAASAAGDVYILGGPYSFDARIAHVSTVGAFPATAGATSIDLGFYKKNTDGTFSPLIASGGAELVSAVDLSAGQAQNDLLEKNAALNHANSIGAICSLTSESQSPAGAYLGLRSNNQITAATFVLNLDVVVDPATTK